MDTKLNKESAKTSEVESVADQVMAAGKIIIDKAQEAVEKTHEVVERAQKEGSKLLESIMQEGEKVRTQTHKLAEEKFEEAKGKLEKAKSKAADSWDNVEQIFEDRVSRVLSRLGIPTRDDFQAIAKRLDSLNHNVKELIKLQGRKKASAGQTLEKDDLKAITGVGPAMEGKLHTDGIYTYRQIATLSAQDVERIETKVIHSSGRIERDKWIEQAKDLHFRKYNEQL
jgi:poly(hydroxyalkanoate) granule-associated protein